MKRTYLQPLTEAMNVETEHLMNIGSQTLEEIITETEYIEELGEIASRRERDDWNEWDDWGGDF